MRACCSCVCGVYRRRRSVDCPTRRGLGGCRLNLVCWLGFDFVVVFLCLGRCCCCRRGVPTPRLVRSFERAPYNSVLSSFDDQNKPGCLTFESLLFAARGSAVTTRRGGMAQALLSGKHRLGALCMFVLWGLGSCVWVMGVVVVSSCLCMDWVRGGKSFPRGRPYCWFLPLSAFLLGGDDGVGWRRCVVFYFRLVDKRSGFPLGKVSFLLLFF